MKEALNPLAAAWRRRRAGFQKQTNHVRAAARTLTGCRRPEAPPPVYSVGGSLMDNNQPFHSDFAENRYVPLVSRLQ